MSVGAICFTSSGSNGNCWVVLVFPCLIIFFSKKGFFSPIRDLRQKKSYAIYAKIKNKKATYAYFHN